MYVNHTCVCTCHALQTGVKRSRAGVLSVSHLALSSEQITLEMSSLKSLCGGQITCTLTKSVDKTKCLLPIEIDNDRFCLLSIIIECFGNVISPIISDHSHGLLVCAQPLDHSNISLFFHSKCCCYLEGNVL